MRVGIFLPPPQATQVRAAIEDRDEICVADSWERLEVMVRHEPLSVVVFSPAADGTMDSRRACKLIRKYASTPFIAYVPVDPAFVRGIAQMANEGLQDVVMYRTNDSPFPFRKTLERASSIPEVGTLAEQLEPRLRHLPTSLMSVLMDALSQPHRYASAEDIAAAADLTLSTLYRTFRNARLNSPKSFVVGARVFRGLAYLRDNGFSIADVATKLGYTHPRIFARHVECVLGVPPSKLRRCIDDVQTRAALLAWFCAAPSVLDLLLHKAPGAPVAAAYSSPSTSSSQYSV